MKLTQEEIEAEPWRFTPSVYGAVLGVHEPYFAETSLNQIALMNGAERRRYEGRREAEWAAWFAVRDTWRTLVADAWREGRFYKSDKGVTDEARSVAHTAGEQVKTARRERELADARAWNEAPGLDKGTRVWDSIAKCYAVLEQAYKRSARVRYVDGPAYLLDMGARKVPLCTLRRYADADLLLRVDGEEAA